MQTLIHASASSITDADLERRTTAYLASRNFLSFRRLTVTSHGGVVTLAGQLPSFHEKQVAQATCQRVAGVLQVIDSIQIVSPKTTAVQS